MLRSGGGGWFRAPAILRQGPWLSEGLVQGPWSYSDRAVDQCGPLWAGGDGGGGLVQIWIAPPAVYPKTEVAIGAIAVATARAIAGVVIES